MIFRLRRAPVVGALFLTVLPAAARASAAPAAPRLASPAAESVVLPGDTAEIAIAGAPRGADEWEAFLSVDGGRTYPLRVTPHLPIDERSFAWTVPALPPGRVRVKARFGVRGVEHEFFLDESFTIGTGPSGTLVAPERDAIGFAPAAGEEGTVAWVDRANGRARLVVPIPERGVASGARWSAAAPATLPAPRRNALFAPDPPIAARPALPRPPALPPVPLGRTIASLSRLNV